MSEPSSRRRSARAFVARRLRGVRLKSPAIGPAELHVVNISESGVGIETTSAATLPEAGQTFSAQLTVGKSLVAVELRVVHINPTVTGLAFVDPSELLRGAIRSYFEPELIAASMKAVGNQDSKVLGQDFTLKFQDEASNSVVLTINNEQLRAFSIGILGNVVEWSEGGAICLVQNAQKEPIGDYLREQLIMFARSLEAAGSHHRQALETIIAST
jgi:hypothetical protein